MICIFGESATPSEGREALSTAGLETGGTSAVIAFQGLLDPERVQKVVSRGRSGTAAGSDHNLIEPLAAQKIVY